MSLEGDRMFAGMEQAEVDANIQFAISLLHPHLVKLLLSNPITKKKLGNQKKDFSQSLQAIIEDWKLFYPAESNFTAFQKYFSRAKQVRHLVAHQSFDRNRYQHYMESLASVATAIGKPELNEVILNLAAVQVDQTENQEEKNQVNKPSQSTLIHEEWALLKEEGNQFYKEERWNDAMNCYTRAIHLNQQEAVLYSNRALCELHLSKLDLAREDIEDAIQLDPKNVKCFRVLSEVLIEMRLYEESLAACIQGLEVDPRDEVLNIRERDCRALIVFDSTWDSAFGKSALKATKEEENEKIEKMISRYKSMYLTSDEIEDCPNFDKFIKISQISKSVDGARQLLAGMSSFNKNGPEGKALEILQAAAKKGNAGALLCMATLHSEGKSGVPRNFHKAIELCRKAASQKAFIRFKETIFPNLGVAEAECYLGACYHDGRGVDRNITEAFKWYLKSAQNDCVTAQNNVGLLLLNGHGCSKNYTSARSWFQKAAERGNAEAQYNYGMMLEKGLGGPVDIIKAVELLQLSADQGKLKALERLQKLSMSGALGGSNMVKSKENLKKIAQSGDVASLFQLGRNYLNGTGGFDKDLRQAERYLREASNKGHADANLPLGKLLLELKDNEEAFEFIKLSAEKGSAEGQCELGILFAYGHGCARDETKASRWLSRAKQKGVLLQIEGRIIEDWVVKEIDCGREVSEFETHQQLSTKGTSLKERKNRFISSKLKRNHPVTPTLEYLRSFLPDAHARPIQNTRSIKEITPECGKELFSRAKNGSATAQSYFNAFEILEQAIHHLARQQTTEAFKLFRFSLRKWDLLIVEFSVFYLDCVKAALKALDRNSQDADALYVLARLDKTQSIEEKLQLAKRCVELDPTVPDFHHYLVCRWSFINDSKNGLRAIDRAIELLPGHLDWLFDRASLLRMTEEKDGKKKYSVYVEEAYLKFISSNPTDHRDYPEACYYLAQIYLLSHEEPKGKMYCQKGLDAEDPSFRLPCFKPIDFDHPAKVMTRMLLKGLEKKDDPAAAPKEMTNDCANCFKSNQSLRCTACKSAWYCDRACQVAHWKKHKVDCKRVNRL